MTYDEELLTEAQICNILLSIEKTILKYRKHIIQLDEEQMKPMIDQLKKLCKDSKDLILGKELELPHEIWL